MKKLLTLLLMISFSCNGIGFARNQKKGDKGMYFAKKIYRDTSLPKFEKDKDEIPVPIIEGNPGWLAIYWKCWELAMNKAKKPYPGSPFVSNYKEIVFA